MNQNHPIELRLNVKPVLVELVHSGAYEGPCRTGSMEALDPEVEKQQAEKVFRRWTQQLKEELTDDARLLDAVKLQWRDDWHLPEEQLRRLDADAGEADVFLIGPGGLRQYPSLAVARRFRKPIVVVGTVGAIDIVAGLRSHSLESYAPLDFDELNRLIARLRVRKAVSRTKILHALEGDMLPVGVVSTIHDLDDLENRLGVRHVTMPAMTLIDRMNDLPSTALQEVEQLVDKLVTGAEQSHMTRDDLLPSAQFFVAARDRMEELECNAFAIPCFELCARRVPAKHRVGFCLAHSLLKDMGYPSACEGDLNVLLAMAVLMYTSRRSSFMGNSSLVSKQENLIRVGHDVPGLKMKGFDTDDLPYTLTPFTQAGWGATIRYDFSRDAGEAVTLARFDPSARRLLLAKAELTGGDGVDTVGCSMGAILRVDNAVELFHQEQYFGHHLAMVYGDYAHALQELGEIMGLEVVEV